MDRDGRWERTDRAYEAIVEGEGEVAEDAVDAVQGFDRGVTDEFVELVVLIDRPDHERRRSDPSSTSGPTAPSSCPSSSSSAASG